MKTLQIFFATVLIANFSLVLAQENWELIKDFEGEGLKKGGVSSIPILEDKDHNIWIVTNSGSIYKTKNGIPTSMYKIGCATPLKQKKFNTEDCFKLFKNSKDQIWLSTKDDGISRFLEGDWIKMTNDKELINDHINCSFEDSMGNLWVGTKKGAALYNGESWTSFTEAVGFTDSEVIQIIEDKNGTIWFNTDKDRCYTYSKNQWAVQGLNGIGNESDNYRALFLDSNERVWVVSTSGIGFYNGTKWTTFGTTLDNVELEEFKKAIGSTYYNLDELIIIREDAYGGIWIAHKNGLSTYNNDTWKSYKKYDGLPDKWQVRSMLADNDGNIYVGPVKNDGVLYKVSKDKLEEIDLNGEKFLVSLFLDKNENLWISGAKGLHKLEKGHNKATNLQKPEFGYMFHDAYQDEAGVIWFGIQGFKSRVLKYSDKTILQ